MTQATLRELGRSVAGASEAKVVQVVGMVDAMANRGPADDLLKHIRSNSAHLMPARPLRFSRLLFLPLNPIIVQAAQWRLGDALIPRSGIIPIAEAVQSALPGAPAIANMIEGHHVGDTAVETAAGRLLWKNAVHTLSGLENCPNWETTTGLPRQAWLEIRTNLCGVWLIADRILGEDAPGLESKQAIAALLKEAEQQFPQAMNAVMSILLATGKNTELMLQVATRHSDHMATLSTQAVSRVLDSLAEDMKGDIGAASLADAADKADHIGEFLASVERCGVASKMRIKGARQEAVTKYADRFARGIEDELFASISLNSAPPSDATIIGMETLARSLHRIATAARRLGGAGDFDASLNVAWSRLSETASAIDSVDRARIAEILFGPDKAECLVSAT